MVQPHFLAGLVLAAGVGLGGQSASTSNPPAAPPPTKAITLVGCVQPDPAKPEWFTLSDTNTGATYRLTGVKVKSYVWRNVRIVGGLVPSPNLAAQAGAIDQTKTAMAYQGSNPPGSVIIQPLEVSVMRVRRLAGSCLPKPIGHPADPS